MKAITTTKIQNSFGKYLKEVMDGEEIVITKEGKEVARLVPSKKVFKTISDSLLGIVPKDLDVDKTKEKYFKEKYGNIR